MAERVPFWHTTWCNAAQPTGGGYPSAYASCNCGYWAAKRAEKERRALAGPDTPPALDPGDFAYNDEQVNSDTAPHESEPDETCPNGCVRYGEWWVPEDCPEHLGVS